MAAHEIRVCWGVQYFEHRDGRNFLPFLLWYFHPYEFMRIYIYIYTYSSREHPEASQIYARIYDTVHHLDG